MLLLTAGVGYSWMVKMGVPEPTTVPTGTLTWVTTPDRGADSQVSMTHRGFPQFSPKVNAYPAFSGGSARKNSHIFYCFLGLGGV